MLNSAGSKVYRYFLFLAPANMEPASDVHVQPSHKNNKIWLEFSLDCTKVKYRMSINKG